MNKIAKIRENRLIQQKGRCCYCQQPMWANNPAKFARKHRISGKQARFLQATAEHLTPRSEGGKDRKANIAAACWFCNTRRHRAKQALSPDLYRRKVQKRMAGGKWHGLRLGYSASPPAGGRGSETWELAP
ncbi:MAG: restriction endonuclease [Alphaproteobacteria bacterium HGW-Alphaproteobacteria-13]|nr:MAG: restriction endonuclease [Alphaproteobacteria bacterium HGW-Alphaproteobacteria-13]